MRIAYYNPALRQSLGAGIHAHELTRAWKELGHEVLELPSLVAGACRDEAESGWPGVGRIGLVIGRDLKRRACARRHIDGLRSAMGQFAPDVAVFRRIDYDYLADACLKTIVVPYVAEVNAVAAIERERLGAQGSLPGERGRERAYLRRADRVVCAAEDIAAEVSDLGVMRQDVAVIHNGVDVERFDPDITPDTEAQAFRKSCSAVVGYCATSSAVHDFDTLAAAAGDLARTHPSVGFLVVGLDPQGVIERFTEHGVGRSQICAIGQVEHTRVPSLLAATDLLWGAMNKQTHFSLKVFEYMAMAKPVVMASDGLGRSPIAMADAGQVVSRGDFSDLAVAAGRLLDDADTSRRAGANGRAWVVEHATWRSVASKMIEGMGPASPTAGGAS